MKFNKYEAAAIATVKGLTLRDKYGRVHLETHS
jgi:hypothetical protein